MATNNNGFSEALKEINTMLKVNKQVEKDVLEEAAKYFVHKLKTRIPVSNRRSKHLRDSLKVVVKDDIVSVEFEDDAFYWHMVEHGHKKANGKGKIKGRHFVQNTFDGEGDKIAEIMAQKIIKKMEG
ncbi:HK97-gp10 family putative phage morphogenesis protein [Metabacillus halosaccharovorans]|uniref:HK97 gp10 family phage protein n=1 Tax=Metabacillus halosaccharovorans TaxID=930124 RepID=A0ABT3DCU1_9BACI|nr:HK97-gp10 family putative phage morphogenesis protein [Metabacillus halosaccharovorans]MCV9884701.1 HK97 gp10 family phage protein [Metabacillus halosaccharovorans]